MCQKHPDDDALEFLDNIYISFSLRVKVYYNNEAFHSFNVHCLKGAVFEIFLQEFLATFVKHTFANAT